MDSRFPLLRLPSKAVLNVLQNMDFFEKIAFSLISKTAKSLTLKTHLHVWFCLNILPTVDLEVLSENTQLIFKLTPAVPRRRSDGPERITMANVVRVLKTVRSLQGDPFNSTTTTHELQKDGFDVRDWIKHMKDITKQKRINVVIYSNGSRFNVDSIAEMLAGFDIHQLSTHNLLYAHRFHCSVLEKLHTKSITMSHNPYRQNPELLQKVMCQNFVSLIFSDMQITLNDILVMNSPVVLIDYCIVDATKTINRFLKLWQAGSSGRLRYIRSMFQFELLSDANVFMRGITHSVIGLEIQRPFVELISGNNGVMMMDGGYDLFRRDGTKATVFIDPLGFEMFVWD